MRQSKQHAAAKLATLAAIEPVKQERSLQVVVDLPQHTGITTTLDYLYTDASESVSVGSLVRVPLGRRIVTGVVWDISSYSAADQLANELKPIQEVWRELPPLPAAWLRLIEFTANYYQRSWGEVALSALPSTLKQLDQIQLQRRLKKLQQRQQTTQASGCSSHTVAPALTAEQQAVLDALAADDGIAQPTLLQGVMGSGKTEVYLRTVQRSLEQNRQSLVLVPEINLTPQLYNRFAERFGHERVVALHSGLTPAQRLQHWLLAHWGLVDVVLGTRLAIFTPLPRLGQIIVDEEHEASYKQQEGARYSARDLAVMRGRLEQVPVLLGSATPSLETWHNATPVSAGGAGRYRRLSMPTRVGGGNLPVLKLIDMARVRQRQSAQAGGAQEQALSASVLEAIQARIARGEQSLVLLNRRGYAPILHCLDCGWKSACPHCSAWRVFHKFDRSLRCHHCGFTERVPKACPDCGNLDIRALGRGTERLEEQLQQALPAARVGRIDGDISRHKGALEAQLASVHAGDVDVLVGTQMVAKGHDFRRISLVVAANPDTALFSTDFRAAERLFALLMQAAGRAGRDAETAQHSEMWIQTWVPQHPLYTALQHYDYEHFAQEQLAARRLADLPPYAHLALVRAEGRSQDSAQNFLRAAKQVASTLTTQSQEITLYQPVPTPIARVANIERAQMLIEAKQRHHLQRFLAAWLPLLTPLARDRTQVASTILRWAVDIDPLEV